MFFLYIKTHLITGIKYLGYTKRKDPHLYKGSGTDWRAHIAIHGYHVRTDIIFQSTCKIQIREMGKFYSNYYNVVGAVDDFGYKIWANRIPETCGGADWTDSAKQKQKLRMQEPDIRKKHISAMADPFTKEKQRINTKAAMSRPEVKSKISGDNNISKRPEVKAKVSGKNNHQYDHKIYTFIHEDGRTVSCHRSEFIKNHNVSKQQVSKLIRANYQVKKVNGWSLMG